MEITTLIQWNMILYGLYYGLNLAFDYYHNRAEIEDESVTYDVKDLLSEAPVIVQNSDYLQNEKSPEPAGLAKEPVEQAEQINFHSAIEGQGIPLPEFLANSRQFSHGVYS